MVLTHNQILKILKDYAESHYQINSFGNGDLWEVVEHDKQADFKYPLMWVLDQPHTTEPGVIEMVYRVCFMDLVQKDESNENEVSSDMLQLCVDLLSFWNQQTLEIQVTIEKNTNIMPFTERFNDEVTGWCVDLKLQVPFRYNKCEIPMDGLTPIPSTCAGVNQTFNGSPITSTPSGGSKAIVVTDGTSNVGSITTDTASNLTVLVTPSSGAIYPDRPIWPTQTIISTYDTGWKYNNLTRLTIPDTGRIQRLDPNDFNKIVLDDSARTGISEHLFRWVNPVTGGYFTYDAAAPSEIPTYYDRDGNVSTLNDEFLQDGDLYMVDRLSWIGWILGQGFGAGLDFAGKLAAVQSQTLSGFSDFYAPSARELFQIMDESRLDSLIKAPFLYVNAAYSGDTLKDVTTFGLGSTTTDFRLTIVTKSANGSEAPAMRYHDEWNI